MSSRKFPWGMSVLMVGALVEEEGKVFRFSCEDDRGPGLLEMGNWLSRLSLSPISWLDGSINNGPAKLGEEFKWGAGEEWVWDWERE